MRVVLDVVAIVFVLVGVGALALAKTSVGEIQALICWVIAAQLLSCTAIIVAIERAARTLAGAQSAPPTRH